jgi:chemotaxis protein MotB
MRRSCSPHRDRWLVSYADFMTLLFSFFVVLYALSFLKKGAFPYVAQSLHAVFSGMPPSPSRLHSVFDTGTFSHPVQVRQKPDATEYQDWLKAVEDGLVGAQESGWRMQALHEGFALEWQGRALFASASALLSDEAKDALRRLAPLLKNTRVRVGGFTDDRPIANEQYGSNWELSAARAMAVLQALLQAGVPPEHASMSAYGAYAPIADNRDALGRLKNRRVVIWVTPLWASPAKEGEA